MGTISIQQVGKAYKRYANPWKRLIEWVSPVRIQLHEQSWVLRDVTLDVRPGESIGLIGENGAGKSTLLKIIAGTTRPTTGRVTVGGRVAALLELGMGFHPDFSGRENVFMAGSLMGMSRAQVAQQLPQIEAFAEIGDSIEQPVRTYSSGMQVRLAFAVATAWRPDILIVDEALSVGDVYFQHKSFDRIRQFREAGTTLLFVSHSADTVKTLCDRAVLLDGGIVLRDGRPDDVLDYYNAIVAKQTADYSIRQVEQASGRPAVTRSGSQAARIVHVDALTDGQRSSRSFTVSEAATFRVEIEAQRAIPDLTVGLLIRDRLGNDVFGTNSWHLDMNRTAVRAGERLAFDFIFEALNLGVGSYSVTLALHSRDAHVVDNYDWWDRALVFKVLPGEQPRAIGVAYLPLTGAWHVPPPALPRSTAMAD